MNWMQKVSQRLSVADVTRKISEGGVLYLKYVRFSGDEYVFGDATSPFIDHKYLSGDQVPVSAAFLKIYPDGLYIEGHSMSLGIGPAPDDESNFLELFNLPLKSRYDMYDM